MKKGETEQMHTGVVEETGFIDMREQLTPKQVKQYVESRVAAGEVEYNNGSIIRASKHPLDQCLKRGIIEQEHYDVGIAFKTVRDCAFGCFSGRIYNVAGEGDGGVDAATLYANTCRKLTKRQWDLVKVVCFPEPRADGSYFTETDYSMLYGLAPNIQSALEALSRATLEAREEIRKRIEEVEKIKPQ
jgi:hypothetical protein